MAEKQNGIVRQIGPIIAVVGIVLAAAGMHYNATADIAAARTRNTEQDAEIRRVAIDSEKADEKLREWIIALQKSANWQNVALARIAAKQGVDVGNPP